MFTHTALSVCDPVYVHLLASRCTQVYVQKRMQMLTPGSVCGPRVQEIANHMEKDTETYEVVQEAIDTMQRVAWHINDMKRKHEHAVRLQVQLHAIILRSWDFLVPGQFKMVALFYEPTGLCVSCQSRTGCRAASVCAYAVFVPVWAK